MIKLKTIIPENIYQNNQNLEKDFNSIISTIDTSLEKILQVQDSLNDESIQYELLNQLYYSIVNGVSRFENEIKKLNTN